MNDRAPGPVLARLRRPAGPHTRFAVVADPHVATRTEGSSKLFEHTREHFATAIEDINQRDVDAVLSPGDLTKDGEPWNYDAVDAVLNDLDAPFYAVPGNHDVPKESDDHETPPVSRFAERYGPDELPFRIEVGGLDLLGVNSAGTADQLVDTHDGRVDRDQRTWLENALVAAERPIVLVHHNFPPVSDQIAAHRDIEPEMGLPPVMREPMPLAETLSEGDAEVVFTGHYHFPLAGTSEGIHEIAAPATCSFPQAYLLCETTPEGTTVRLIPVADESGLAHAHARRSASSVTSRGLTALSAARLASFPLIDDR